ncbi:MAG: anti-sigma factor family protein [Noviherbaspirillum sp.]
MNLTPVTETELQAWVDGRLTEPRRAEIEAWLSERPAEAERLLAYRRQNEALRVLFDPVLEEAAPPSLQKRPRLWLREGWRIAAAVLIALSGGAVGWTLHGQLGQNGLAYRPTDDMKEFARHAAIAHAVYSPEVRHPVEVGADQEAHLSAWLSKRLGSPVRPPRLNKEGYELIGGRLLPGENGPVALFMYQDAGGERLTVYLSAGKGRVGDTGFRYASDGPVNVFYWIDGKYGYAISARADRQQLTRVAAAIHEQFSNG